MVEKEIEWLKKIAVHCGYGADLPTEPLDKLVSNTQAHPY